MKCDQYAAAATESLARLAVEQASRAVDLECEATRESYANDYEAEAEYADAHRGVFESLVRCVDELARRATEGEGR